MNKKLLAVAIAGAIAAPMAALADEGNVTISGHVGLAVESTSAGGASSAGLGRSTNVSSNGSDLSISGWEGLGNGLKAVFLMKSFVGMDNGSLFTAGGKDGYAGLAGAFGTVALGFHGQPYKTSTAGMDIFNDTIADNSSIMNGNGLYDSGIGHALIWFLPNMNGFSGHLQYGFDGNSNGNSDQWGAQFNYSNGPWYATYAHADVRNDRVGGIVVPNSGRRADKIAGTYTFAGTTTLGLIWENLRASDGVIAAHARHNAWEAMLSHNMGNNTFKLAYATANNEKNTSDTGAHYWAVGLDHHLSKRTMLYGLYTKLNNKANGNYALGVTGSSNAAFPNPGDSPSSFAVGIKHSF